MPSQAELEQVRRSLDKLSKAAAADWRTVWDSMAVADQALMTKALTEAWVGVVGQYGEMAAALGADLFESQAYDMGIRPKVELAAGVNPDRATRRLGWAMSTVSQSGNLAVLLDELVKQPYRSTVQDSAFKSGAGWARVPSSREPCSFCLMLASRGGVYSSKGAASLGSNGKKYHGDCHCVPTLVRGPEDYPKGYDPNALYDAYSVARGAADSTSTPDILSELRRQQDTN